MTRAFDTGYTWLAPSHRQAYETYDQENRDLTEAMDRQVSESYQQFLDEIGF